MSAGVNAAGNGASLRIIWPCASATAHAWQDIKATFAGVAQTRTLVVGDLASWPGIALAPASPTTELRPSAPATNPAARNDRFTQKLLRQGCRSERGPGGASVHAQSRRYQQAAPLRRSAARPPSAEDGR